MFLPVKNVGTMNAQAIVYTIIIRQIGLAFKKLQTSPIICLGFIIVLLSLA